MIIKYHFYSMKCLQQRFAIASPHPNKRSHPPHPKQRSHPHIPKAIAPPHIPKRDRTPTSQKRSHPHIPKSDLIPIPPNSDSCGALRYRTPKPQKRFLRSASLSHSPHPQKQPSDHYCIVFLYLSRFYTNNQIQFS
jgi:hypothetical protein